MVDQLFPQVGVVYHGRAAASSRIDVYDYSRAIYGLSRSAAILAEYYKTGKVIAKAPASTVQFYVEAAEQGSFKQALAAAAIGGICAAPFGPFFTRVVDDWLPTPDIVAEQELAAQNETNELLQQIIERMDRAENPELSAEEDFLAEEFIKKNEKDLNVLRSILAGSFSQIFRPVGRSAEYSNIYGSREKGPEEPTKLVTPTTAALIEADNLDEKIRTINARVTRFTRGSKTGLCFSEEFGHGFRFEYKGKNEKLPTRDIFSYSQYEQEDIIMEGQFVYYFDGKIKKFIVYYAQKAKGA